MKRFLLLLSACVALLGISAPSYAYTRCYEHPYYHCVRYIPAYRPVVYESRPYYGYHHWHHHHWHHRHWHRGSYGRSAVVIYP